MRYIIVAACVLGAYGYAATVTAADKTDPRLVTANTAFVFAADSLKDDQPVAACLAERLEKLTPYKTGTKDGADVLLVVKANINGAMGKSFGALGVVRMEAKAQDGKVLWSGLQNVGTQQFGTLAPSQEQVACVLAEAIAEQLRGAMRKARDKK